MLASNFIALGLMDLLFYKWFNLRAMVYSYVIIIHRHFIVRIVFHQEFFNCDGGETNNEINK